MDFYKEGQSLEGQAVEPENQPSLQVEMPLSLVDEELIEKLKSIPEKMAFKIGEVADILGVKQYVLRYWETEFSDLNPKKSGNNQRIYTRKNVETALLIQKLLHRDRFSIEGARKIMQNSKQDLRKYALENLKTTGQSESTAKTDQVEIKKELSGLVSELRDFKELFS